MANKISNNGAINVMKTNRIIFIQTKTTTSANLLGKNVMKVLSSFSTKTNNNKNHNSNSTLNSNSDSDAGIDTNTPSTTIDSEHRKCRNERDKFRKIAYHRSSQSSSCPFRKHLWYLLLLLATTTLQTITAIQTIDAVARAATRTTTTSNLTRYSQPIKLDDDEENFRPLIPKDPEYVARYMFTNGGQYRVFQQVESDLRLAAAMRRDASGYNAPQDEGAATEATTNGQKTTEAPLLEATINKLAWHLVSEQNLNQAVPSNLARTQTPNETEDDEAVVTAADHDDDDDDGDENENEHAEDLNDEDEAEVLGTAEAIDDFTNDNEDDKSQFEIENSANNIIDDFRARDNADEHRSDANSTEQNFQVELHRELRGLEELLIEYVDNFFNKGQYEPMPGLVIELQKNLTNNELDATNATAEHSDYGQTEITNRIKRHLLSAVETGSMNVNIPRALQSGRLLFITGLKKFLWPLWMGLNILKSVLLAMFLPALIGSFGKLLGKGIISGSAPLFVRPMDTPQELDFRDNTFNFDDDDNKFIIPDEATKNTAGYGYQAEASQKQNQYAYNANAINQQALSRYGNNEKQVNLMQDSYLSALQSISSASFKNSQSLSGSSSGALGGGAAGLGGGDFGGGGGGIAMTAPNIRNKPLSAANVNTFQTFQKVPASSLLLSNYDPFYSPLLSRLDSVFAQLKLNSKNEVCREKLICLMYANPAKYAPYSNLVSAQLSRELNELRKPTSDNPDILRFFKYMRAAKDGQDGVDCEQSFDQCKEFKDFDNPAMLSTYNDINKLVQARKLK